MDKEELLSIINTAFASLLTDINYKETRAKYKQAKAEIVALIKKGVTEEWIEEKAKELDSFFGTWWGRFGDFDTTPEEERDIEFAKACQGFIRSLVNEIEKIRGK